MPETTNEIEIRRIEQTEGEAAVELWDRMVREEPGCDGLSPLGRRNLHRMLEIAAWHRDLFALVAVRSEELVGVGLGRIDTGGGLLPGSVGLCEELWVAPDVADRAAVRRTLGRAVVQRLLAEGAGTLRAQFDAEDADTMALYRSLGFDADMVTMSYYPRDTSSRNG